MNTGSNNTPDDKKPVTPTGGSGFSMNRFLLKVKYAFYSTLVFIIFANPETLKLLQSAVKHVAIIATPEGVPTMLGLFGMAFMFFATMLSLMMMPSE